VLLPVDDVEGAVEGDDGVDGDECDECVEIAEGIEEVALPGPPGVGVLGPELEPGLAVVREGAAPEARVAEDDPHPERAKAPPPPTIAASRVRRSTVRMARKVTGNTCPVGIANGETFTSPPQWPVPSKMRH
jgi:hypothetical protein